MIKQPVGTKVPLYTAEHIFIGFVMGGIIGLVVGIYLGATYL